MTLTNKIDFAVVLSVKNANPNGDPLFGNMPRTTLEGIGEMSDVSIKRKIRNRLQEKFEIFLQSDDRLTDGFRSLQERLKNSGISLPKKHTFEQKTKVFSQLCDKWIDVRTFGQVFAFKGGEDLTLGVRGPVSIQSAFTLDPINITELQITKSTNGSETDGGKSSDTMGRKYRVDSGVYVFYGSISTQLAEKTGFTNEDAEELKQALISLFEGDSSSARPDGSMIVNKVYWWTHENKYGNSSSYKVHQSLTINRLVDEPCKYSDYEFTVTDIPGVNLEVLEGF